MDNLMTYEVLTVPYALWCSHWPSQRQTDNITAVANGDM